MSPSPLTRRANALGIVAYSVLGLLLVPVALFFAFYFAVGGPAADHGHPPAIILPYLYTIFGFRFLAPVGAAAGLLALLTSRSDEPDADACFRAVGACSRSASCSRPAAWRRGYTDFGDSASTS